MINCFQGLLSSFNLRRYNEGAAGGGGGGNQRANYLNKLPQAVIRNGKVIEVRKVGRWRLTLSNPRSNRLELSA